MKLNQFINEWNAMIERNKKEISESELVFLEKTMNSLQLDQMDAMYDLELEKDGTIKNLSKKQLDKMKPFYYNKSIKKQLNKG